MESLEWATQVRVVHDELIAEAERYRQARALRAAQRSHRAAQRASAPQLTVRHLWWHRAVQRLHRSWSPRPTSSQDDCGTARNVG
jgi:hypothetical protein